MVAVLALENDIDADADATDDGDTESDDIEAMATEDDKDSEVVASEKLEMFTKAYNQRREEQKWKLSTGKCIEDELYKFARQCTYEHPSLSFIVDAYDATYMQHGVFTESELQEIKDYNPVVMEKSPQDLVDYLMLFDCRTTEELRKACLENQKWIAEFEAGSLKVQHHENWYMVRIWSLIDRIFADVDGLEAVRGESTRIATASRKNQDRVIPSMVKMKRKAMGRRGDLILRKGTAEYGCAEAGAKDEGQWGTKKLLEKGIKAAKILKDMFNHLYHLVDKEDYCGLDY
ncbi:hypothetical protein Unana1_05449 [Umbelopsis nana]